MEVIFAFDLACKKEAAHRAGGTDDAQHAEEGGRVLVGGHFFLVPKGQDNGRVKIQVNLKFSKIDLKKKTRKGFRTISASQNFLGIV